MIEHEAPVLRLLRDGKWRTINDLSVVLGLARRDIESAIEELRLAGEPIIGGSEGVKLTADPLELDAYVQQRRYRAASIHKGTMRLRTTLRRLRGHDGAQGELWRDVA